MDLHVATAIEIEATPDEVWAVLMDFERYPDWNPFVRSITGSALPGARLSVSIQPPGGRRMSFRPRVLTVSASRELRWKGQLLVPGLLDGEHYFQLEPVAVDRTCVRLGEHFSGLLVRLMQSGLNGPTRLGFEMMNQALKRRAEFRHADAHRAGTAAWPCTAVWLLPPAG